MSKFTDFLFSAADSAERHVAKCHQAGVLAGHQAMVDNTIVWSGWARGNYDEEIGNLPYTPNPRPAGAKEGDYPYPEMPIAEIEKIKAGDTVVIGNNVPYAPVLDKRKPILEPAKIATEDAMERKIKEGKYE